MTHKDSRGESYGGPLTIETAQKRTENIWLLSGICHICSMYTCALHVVIKKITEEPVLLLKAMTKGRCPSKMNLPR